MKYWLDLFTPYTWTKFQEHGASVTGFRPRQRTAAFERVSLGDALLCYLVRLSRWCGALAVASEAFETPALSLPTQMIRFPYASKSFLKYSSISSTPFQFKSQLFGIGFHSPGIFQWVPSVGLKRLD